MYAGVCRPVHIDDPSVDVNAGALHQNVAGGAEKDDFARLGSWGQIDSPLLIQIA